ncbi:MAG: MBL fold metallo-hydrolase, partial [Clostridia bacterium]|nr:MBL fold metallo-hydrolase [Clostridia bacterium]
DGFDLPLRAILEKLTWGYYGVYNVEPDFPRLAEEFTPLEVLERSVPTLKKALFPTAELYDRIRREFDRSFLQSLSVKEKREGTHLGLVHAASYLFNTQGYFWGMDLAFRACYDLSETPHRVAELLKDLKLMVITHGHRDHFEERTIRALAENDTLWLIPDFLEEKALSFGLKKEKIILAKKDEPVTVGPLTFLPFESRHFRPVTGKGVREYGYYVTSPNQPSMAFPGDIRDYENPAFPFENADVCFSHIWYSDDNRKVESLENVLPLAKFALKASKKKIFLCHLYENGRPDHVMWRMEHAEKARKEILALSPETRVYIPDWGEIIEL